MTYLNTLLRPAAVNPVRAKAEYRKFVKLLQHSLSTADPRTVTTECVDLLAKMMRIKVDVRFDVLLDSGIIRTIDLRGPCRLDRHVDQY